MNILGFEISTSVLLLLVTVLLYVYFTWNHDFWKKRGVPGPRPLPLLGNSLDLLMKGIKDSDRDLVHKYGNVVGVFMGSNPRLLISDLDMIKQVMVKEFSFFVNRIPESVSIKEYPISKFMTALTDDHWKHVRNSLTPAFSGNKLRRMMRQINDCADVLVQNLTEKAQTGEPFEIKEYTGGYSMDAIASVGFGIQMDSQKDPDNPFVKNAKKAFAKNLSNPVLVLALFFPKIYSLLSKVLPLHVFPMDVSEFFVNVVHEAIAQRKEHKELQDRTDFLQLMLNIQIDDPKPENSNEEMNEFIADKRSGPWSKKGLTHEEILAQSLIFLIAGYDTTATTLAFLAYNLAMNPECQEKLHDEIESVLAGKDAVTYDMVHHMPYMEMCIQESLRHFPPVVRLERVCSDDTTINGVFIPRQSTVSIPIYTMHHDADIWPEPEEFKPERFTTDAKAERDPFCYMPFGMGPRNCIGMRLAQIEIKVALAKLLPKMKFTKCSKTEIPLKLTKLDTLMYAKNGIYLTTETR